MAEEPTDSGTERAAEAPPDQAAPEASDAKIVELETELAATKDRMLRALAEVENVRRRAERERQDMAKYANTAFARDMLAVADNLRRALAAMPSGEADERMRSFVVGIEMTEREMLNALDRNGVRPIAAEGQKFDHNLHEALFEVEDPAKPAGTVVQVLETGYTINDRLLRPAKVGISRGGAATAAPAPANDTAPPEGPADTPTRARAYEKRGDPGTGGPSSGASVDEKT